MLSKLIKNMNDKELSLFNKDFEFYSKSKDKSSINYNAYKQFLVIKMLLDGASYKSIQQTTGFGRSTIPVIAKRFNNNSKNFYKDGRSTKSILNKYKYDIRELFDKTVPSSLSDACNILFNDKDLRIKCGKTTMKEFIDRNGYNDLIIGNKELREKKLKKIKDKQKALSRYNKMSQY